LDSSIIFVDWNLPEHEVLELDYTSWLRPPENALALEDSVYDDILVSLQNSVKTEFGKTPGSPIEPIAQLQALRMVSHHFFLDCTQIRDALGIFKNDTEHSEVVVTLFARTIDMASQRLLTASLLDESLQHLQERLGYFAFFPFLQPEQRTLQFNLEQYEDRLAASQLVALAKKENRANLRNPILDGNAFSVPDNWDDVKKLPVTGFFTITYACAPEDRDFSARRDAFLQYTGWTSCVEQTEAIPWWAVQRSAPREERDSVLSFADFLSVRYDHACDAFHRILGAKPDVKISNSAFLAGIKDVLDFHVFKGQEGEAGKLQEISKYLNSANDGQISQENFSRLDDLCKDAQFAMLCFLAFCSRTFASATAPLAEILQENVKFKPGDIGIDFLEDGKVADIKQGGQADQLGVKNGWTLIKLEDARPTVSDFNLEKEKLEDTNYTKQRLDELIAAHKGFTATFYKEQNAPTNAEQQLSPILEAAWFFIDVQGTGLVSADAFEAHMRRVGYFGDARRIFRILDGKGAGVIGREDFKLLERFEGRRPRSIVELPAELTSLGESDPDPSSTL